MYVQIARVESVFVLTVQIDFDSAFKKNLLAFSQLALGVLQHWRLQSAATNDRPALMLCCRVQTQDCAGNADTIFHTQ